MAIVLDGSNGITTNSGTVISASTIGVGGATPSTSGAGITFPATQSASTDANTLDDYEEGTWTPNIGSGSATITSVSGQYTKIGNRVICSFKFTCNSTGSITYIGGLPFTVINSHCGAGRETSAGGLMWAAESVASQTYFTFRQYDNGSTMTNTHVYLGTVIYQG
jgi:hypothetical protein